MNLHDRYSPLHLSERQMEQSLTRLFEIYQQLDKDLMNESLTTGRMSNFLFEADQETIVVNTAEEARDATMRNLDVMQGVGERLNNSKTIDEFVKQLRSRLTKIILDTGKFATLKDFAGVTIKQISFIGNSLAKGMKSIDAAIDALIKSMDTMKIDWKNPEDPDLTVITAIELWISKNQKSGITVDKFKQGIKQKMAEITGQGAKGIFSKIMDMIKGASIEPIVMDGDKFADELLRCTGKQINEYLNGPAPKLVKDPPPGTTETQELARTVKISPEELQNARPPGTPPAKLKATELVNMSPEELKDTINRTAKAFDAKGDIIEQSRSFHRSNTILSERWEKLAGIKGDLR